MGPKPLSEAPAIGSQATAVVTGSLLAGAMMGLSAMVIPVFLDTGTEPAHMLRQWARLYHYGSMYMPAVCIATCGLYGYTAISKRALNGDHWFKYAVAGVTTFSMIPFTLILMAPTNNTLFALEASTSAKNLSTVQGLLTKWMWLHAARCIFPLIGAILGFSVVMQELGL